MELEFQASIKAICTKCDEKRDDLLNVVSKHSMEINESMNANAVNQKKLAFEEEALIHQRLQIDVQVQKVMVENGVVRFIIIAASVILNEREKVLSCDTFILRSRIHIYNTESSIRGDAQLASNSTKRLHDT